MKPDPVLSEYFRQLNATLAEVIALYQAQVQIGRMMAEKSSDKEDGAPASSGSD